MQSSALEYKIGKCGARICSFSGCQNQTGLLEYSHHRLCPDHYNYILLTNLGEQPIVCKVPMCYRMNNLVEYDGHLLCQGHYRKINRGRVHSVPGSCYIDTCPETGTHEFKGKIFCSFHCHKIRKRTETPKRNEYECNYVGCTQPWSVSGFNSRWCPQHYLEMCAIREQIKHDNSETDLAARLKEINVRKDGFTETGLRHRWYYLQLIISSLSQ